MHTVSQSFSLFRERLRANRLIAYSLRHSSLLLELLLTFFLFTSWMGFVIVSAQGAASYSRGFDLFFTILRYGGYVLMLGAALLSLTLSKRRQNPIVVWTVLIVSVLVFLFSRSTEFAILTLYLFAFRSLSLRRGLRVYLLVLTTVLGLVLALSVLHVFPDVIMDTERSRHALGFAWVSTAPVLFLFLLIALLLCDLRALNTTALMALAGMSVLFYFLTDTRFAFLLSLLLLILIGLLQSHPAWFSFMHKRWFGICLALLPVVLAIVALGLMLAYTPGQPFWESLNGLLSGRLANARTAFDQYGLSLAGKHIVWQGNGPATTAGDTYLYVDCSYLNILLNFGVLEWLLVLGCCSCIAWQAYRKKNVPLMIALFIVYCFSFNEVRLLNPVFNPLLLYASHLLSQPFSHLSRWFASHFKTRRKTARAAHTSVHEASEDAFEAGGHSEKIRKVSSKATLRSSRPAASTAGKGGPTYGAFSS